MAKATKATAKKTTAAAAKTAAKAVKEEVKETAPVAEKKVEAKVEAPVVEEKKTAAKTTAKASETKKTTAKTTKAAKAEVFVEFSGVQVSIDEVVENVKKTFAAEGNNEEVKSVKVYLKPEDQAAYYVVNDTIEGKMDVYFC